MIATYPLPGKSPDAATAPRDAAVPSATANRGGYLNEVSARPAVTGPERLASGEHRES
jgi:hypothetical protein